MISSADVVWLAAPGAIEIRNERLAPPGPGELLCETIVTAISPGTELAAYTGKPPLRSDVAYPRLQGYCNVARVLASDAPDFAPGVRVLSFASHRSHFVLPASEVLCTLPDGDAASLACAYLYHLGYNAVIRGDVRAGSRVLVVGLGALGLTSVTMAALAGAEVFALSDQPAPSRLALSLGARGVFGRGDEASLALALGPGADVVIATTNDWCDWQAALRLAAQNGTIACLGFPGRGQPPPDANPLASEHFYMKQLRIEAVGWSPERPDSRGFLRFNERANLAWLAGLIATGRIDPAAVISGRYPGRDIATAYDDLLARRDSAVTYVLDWVAR